MKNILATMLAFLPTSMTVFQIINHYHLKAPVVVTQEELQIQMMMKKMMMNFPRKEKLFKTKVFFTKGFCGWF